MDYCYQLKELGDIANLPNLTELSLRSTFSMNLDGINKLVKLKRLVLESRRNPSIPDISGLIELDSLELSGNNLTKDDLIGVVPDKFTNDKVWLADATTKSVKNGLSYYTYMDEDVLLSKISQTTKKASVNIAADCAVEVGADFIKIT